MTNDSTHPFYGFHNLLPPFRAIPLAVQIPVLEESLLVSIWVQIPDTKAVINATILGTDTGVLELRVLQKGDERFIEGRYVFTFLWGFLQLLFLRRVLETG